MATMIKNEFYLYGGRYVPDVIDLATLGGGTPRKQSNTERKFYTVKDTRNNPDKHLQNYVNTRVVTGNEYEELDGNVDVTGKRPKRSVMNILKSQDTMFDYIQPKINVKPTGFKSRNYVETVTLDRKKGTKGKVSKGMPMTTTLGRKSKLNRSVSAVPSSVRGETMSQEELMLSSSKSRNIPTPDFFTSRNNIFSQEDVMNYLKAGNFKGYKIGKDGNLYMPTIRKSSRQQALLEQSRIEEIGEA
jgi:hypothetical protein